MRLLILHIALMLGMFAASAENKVDVSTFYVPANEAFIEKDYEAAVKGYEQVLALGHSSDVLFYNLGNAYFRLDKMGMAILNYERALKLNPELDDAAFNLKLANLRISDRVTPATEFILVSWYKSFVHGRSASGWGMWALAAVWLALVLGAIYLLSRMLWLRRLCFGVMALLLVSSIVLIVFARMQYQYQLSSDQGIIIVTNTYVKAAPDENSTDLFILREGTKVTLLETENGWQKVKLPDDAGDKVGWVAGEMLGVI